MNIVTAYFPCMYVWSFVGLIIVSSEYSPRIARLHFWF